MPRPSPGDLPNLGIARLLHLLDWQVGSLPLAPLGKPLEMYTQSHICLRFAVYSWEVAGGGRSLSL